MEWISVKDKLPKYCESVLIWCKEMTITSAYLLECDLWIINDWDEHDVEHRLDHVTHWLPLPKPPNEE